MLFIPFRFNDGESNKQALPFGAREERLQKINA
jgi:hypothetical protein